MKVRGIDTRQAVLATHNPDKGREIAALLERLPLSIRTLAEFPDAPEVIEDGETCHANALKKATVLARHTGLLAIADDTGLMVDALDGRPGVYAARYAGEHATYEENWRKLLRELEGVPIERRRARFLTVAVAAGGFLEQPHVVEGVLDGIIALAPAGRNGFGYNPAFYSPELGRTLAALTPDEKNRVSHRARAFSRLREVLQGLLDRSPD